MSAARTPTRVLFVCLGNICRSPTAHAVFEQRLRARRLDAQIEVDSAGTGDWHIGRAPDQRAAAAASARGYDLSHLRARQVTRDDFERFHYILAMDRQNLVDLEAICPAGGRAELGLFLDYARAAAEDEVPDPYYGGDQGFELVLDLVEDAADGLIEHLTRQGA